MAPLLRKLIGTNWWLVLAMYGLLVFGLFAIESAARHLPGAARSTGWWRWWTTGGSDGLGFHSTRWGLA